MFKSIFAFAALMALAVGGALVAEERVADKKIATDATTNQNALFRASTIIGMEVRNRDNEKVGTIDDLVLDLHTGKTRYAAMAVGGFLGIGERLFAVPMASFTVSHEGTTRFLVLDVNKDRLKAAPGFAKDQWPDMANPKFGEDIDRYYGTGGRTTTINP
jgi:sporulation protein YlmC with PRC-barrel domain